ncbi:nucleolar complex protein 14 [Ceratobasidium theobromae]|uniref:Nucleolar complex protein 14 n=1 Tax=Ceratobasidium theobromae TaxID=1582974 RepID=A0A5N5QNK4_9AGAM|nr:nucleolar complex protein 14 [Ceratobasidium theobromae]
MGKLSQLKQLKSALNSAGLSRKSRPSNKKKRGSSDGTAIDKAKRAAKLEAIQRRLNPFDEKVTKLKHDVGGRKLKGVVGHPSASKQTGIEQRKKTLLIEYNQKDRAGGIIDRRFGENDTTISPEERMLERFTRERQRQAKGAVFNLEDDEELTHYGQSLSALDDFDDTGIELDDDEDGGQIDANVVRQSHFGGFGEEEGGKDQPERKKSKAEVMSEVIAKSKAYKAERQEQREADDNIRHELDQDFASIRGLLYAPAPPDPSSSGSNSIPLGRPRAQPAASDTLQEVAGTDAGETNSTKRAGPIATTDEDYDQFIRELVFDKRSRPTDRLKTEEELAREAAEALEKAEKARLRRMRGEESESGDERGGKRKRRVAQADDLEDDFIEDHDVYGLGMGLEGKLDLEKESSGGESQRESGESGDEDEDEDEDEGESEGEPDISDLSDGAGDQDEPVEGEIESLIASRPRSSKSQGETKATSEPTLPYTFPFPSTHEELLEILENVQEKDIPTVIHRIRVQYHPSLAEGNKQKLQSLIGVLLDYILHAAAPPSPSFELVSTLTPHIYALSTAYPITAAQTFTTKLTLMQKNLARGLAQGALLPDSRTWPGSAELALLRLVGIVWSTSDLNHAVGTPAMLLIGQYLAQARVRRLNDIASGLFLCTLALQYESYSKRLVPETINFLINACLHLSPHKFMPANLPGWFPASDLNSTICQGVKLKSSGKVIPGTPTLSDLLNLEGDGGTQDKVDLLALTFTLLAKFAQMYASLSGFIELFSPVREILEGLALEKQSTELQKRRASTVDAISRTLKHSLNARTPLHLQAHKPIPIATYIPQFDAQYTGRRPHDPDHERAAGAKLRAEYRKERKGALRELRKDNKFLAAERARRREEADTAYKQRMARVVGEMHSERAEQKQMEREKKREKRRVGRK